MMEFDGLLSHPGLHGPQLHRLILHRGFSIFQSFQALQPCPLLGGSGAASPLRPFQLHPQDTLTLPLRGKLHLLPCRFQLKEAGIIRIISVHLPVADLQDPVRHTIKEIPVMGHHEDGPSVSPQILFQPCDHRPVQMVRGLVQEKYVKISGKGLCQDHSPLLSAGEMFDLLIQVRDPQLRQIALHLPVLPCSLLKGIGADIRSLRESRILGDIGDLKSVLSYDLPSSGTSSPATILSRVDFPARVN